MMATYVMNIVEALHNPQLLGYDIGAS